MLSMHTSSLEISCLPSRNEFNQLLTVEKKIPGIAENFFARYCAHAHLYGVDERRAYFYFLHLKANNTCA